MVFWVESGDNTLVVGRGGGREMAEKWCVVVFFVLVVVGSDG